MNRQSRPYGAYVFDCDGTLYVGDVALPGAIEAVNQVRARGAQTLFLTNNPTRSTAEYAGRLTRMGLETPASDVVSSIDALVAYLRRQVKPPTVMVIAEELLHSTLIGAGFDIREDPHDGIDIVVVAFDRTFDYAKLKRAFDAVNAGARIVATNPDRYCPSLDGGLPDCAAMLAALEACTGVRADAVVGKPSRHMAAVLLDRLQFSPDETLLVGDRIETDLAMAHELHTDFALVLTGATSADDPRIAELAPDHVLSSVKDLPGAQP